MASPTTPAAGTEHTSERTCGGFAGSPVSKSTEATSARTDERGRMAARTTTGAPLVTPPSSPPARLVARAISPPRQAMGSWASIPRRPARSKAGPTSTPLTAWMEQSAWASRPSSLRSQCA